MRTELCYLLSQYKDDKEKEGRNMLPYLAGILTASPVSCTHHLIIDDNIDAVGLVPAFTEAVVYHWHIHSLQSLRTKSGT
jgi:hypothetical protein